MVERISLVLLAAGALTFGVTVPSSGSTTSVQAALSCAPASGGGTTVGSITSVPSPEAKVDSSSAFTGKRLLNRNMICTSSTGQVKYKLTRSKTTYCNSGTPPHASKVRLYPKAGVIAEWVSGWTWCNTGGGSQVTYSSSGRARMKASDPLFGVFVARDRSTTAKVALGFLDVSGRSEKGVIVGPGQEVTAPAGGDPGDVRTIDLTSGDRETIDDLQALVPSPKFGRPSAGSSAVLAQIYSRKAIRVGFDASRANDPRTSAFVKGYFTELAKLWKLKPEFLTVRGSSASAELASGRIDVAITPAALPTRLDVFPFFGDARRLLWRIGLARDADWNAALLSYVVATLNTARYAASYQSIFRTGPPYKPLRPLLFP